MERVIITLLSCMLLLCDCTQSSTVALEGSHVPDAGIRSDVEIEWGQIWDDLDVQFPDKELYPFSENTNGNVMDEENKIDSVLLTNEEITKEQANEHATVVLKGLNGNIATQDFSFNLSDEEFYGDSVSNNGVSVLVAPALLFEDPSAHILEDTIKADEGYRLVRMSAAE